MRRRLVPGRFPHVLDPRRSVRPTGTRLPGAATFALQVRLRGRTLDTYELERCAPAGIRACGRPRVRSSQRSKWAAETGPCNEEGTCSVTAVAEANPPESRSRRTTRTSYELVRRQA